MATRVYLIRHGETVWNRENRTQGWSDIELNANGQRHAAAIARALLGVPLGAVYASTLSRAIATAQAIASRHNLTVVTDADLRELHQGTLDGLTFEELRRDHGDFLKEWASHPGPLTLPGGESMSDLQERAWGALQRIVAAHPEGTVAVVSHNLTIVTVLCRLLGIDLNGFRRLRQEVANINIIDFGGPQGASLLRMNDTAHLTQGSQFANDVADIADTLCFSAAALPEADIMRLVAALCGANASQGACHLLVVGAEERRRRLVDAFGAALARTGDVEGGVMAAMESAPVVLAVLCRDDESVGGTRLGAAIQNVRVAAHALGYGTAWLAGEACTDSALASVLEVAAPWQLTALLPVGLPAMPAAPGERAVDPGAYTIMS